MASYSLDLRERVVKAHVEEGQNKSAVARRFEVSVSTVKRYVKRQTQGQLAARRGGGRKRLLDAGGCEQLRRQVQEHHDWSLTRHAEELAKATGVELKSSVGNYLKRLGITHKLGPKASGLILKRASFPPSEMS